MIGDWVIHNNATPMQVSVVKQDCFACSQPYLYDYNNEFSPIPITPEILEANGFYIGHTSQEEDLASAIGMPLRGEGKWCVDDGDVEITVSFPNESDGGMVTIDNLRDKYMQFLFEETIYVHELQQALRLCGLNEIADNFKVE